VVEEGGKTRLPEPYHEPPTHLDLGGPPHLPLQQTHEGPPHEGPPHDDHRPHHQAQGVELCRQGPDAHHPETTPGRDGKTPASHPHEEPLRGFDKPQAPLYSAADQMHAYTDIYHKAIGEPD
jgi:hypothetical protein